MAKRVKPDLNVSRIFNQLLGATISLIRTDVDVLALHRLKLVFELSSRNG